MYELGLRQAFNKKTVLIKDDKTLSPFDVQAFRYFEYDSSMRIDNAQNNTSVISKAISSTFTAEANEVNSIVQLLKIQPAQVGEITVLSQENTLILKAIKELQQRIIPQGLPTIPNIYDQSPNDQRYSNIGEPLLTQLDFYPVGYLVGNYYKNTQTKKDLGFLTGTISDKHNRSFLTFKDGSKNIRLDMDAPELSWVVEELPF